jgi:hypothetical protein
MFRKGHRISTEYRDAGASGERFPCRHPVIDWKLQGKSSADSGHGCKRNAATDGNNRVGVQSIRRIFRTFNS